jgi:Trypsin-co-occurring domain 1
MDGRRAQQDKQQDELILVEFAQRPGLQQVALTPVELAQRSAAAINKAMAIIHQMGDRLQGTVASMAQRPDEMQVSFGLKFDAEAGAFIAKTGVEASLNVTLTWLEEPRHV